jgi:hypothetical protein
VRRQYLAEAAAFVPQLAGFDLRVLSSPRAGVAAAPVTHAAERLADQGGTDNAKAYYVHYSVAGFLTSGRVLRRRAWIIVPCALVLLYGGPLIVYQLPNNFDTLTESFEPLKTLKFIYSRGRAFHKWGPMSSLIYAPVYALPMTYWYHEGDIASVGTAYPYGFKRPFEQVGALIALARTVGLLFAMFSIVVYGRALTRITGSRLAACLALTLCIATSSRLLTDFVSTKPDGLMLAFLILSMAVYTDIVASGLTRQRGCLLSVLAVCSISCKELTAALYIPLFAGLAVAGIARLSAPGERRRFVGDYMFAVAVGVLTYLMLNVAYAPATWRLRMAEWLVGPGMDSRVWAPAGYTFLAHVSDALHGAVDNFGPGAMPLVAAALIMTPVRATTNQILLWLPAIGFVTFVMTTTGYVPDYFLSPLNVVVVLPVAVTLAAAEESSLQRRRRVRFAFVTILLVMCLMNAWAAGAVWVRASLLPAALEEKYCVENVSRRELIHTANLWVRQPGADRLSYLGFDVDDRPLGDVMTRKGRDPDVILISREELTWLAEFKMRPARDAMLVPTGYHYRDFPGLESRGYRVETVIQRHVPRVFDIPWLRDLCLRSTSDILVFRRSPRQARIP